jgi:hypothetical protein
MGRGNLALLPQINNLTQLFCCDNFRGKSREVNMIPTIGIMVGLYIITRMLSLLLKNKEGKESIVTGVFAGITILFTLYSIYSLFTSGVDLSQLNM